MASTGNLQPQDNPASGLAQGQPPAGPRLRMLSEGRSERLIRLINRYDRGARQRALSNVINRCGPAQSQMEVEQL